MSIDEIRGFRNAQPFHPFTLLLNDGRLLRVELPQRIALAPDDRRIAVYQGDRLSLIEIEQVRIASAEEHPTGQKR